MLRIENMIDCNNARLYYILTLQFQEYNKYTFSNERIRL